MTGIPADAGRDGRFGLSVKQPESTLPQPSALPRLPQLKPKNPNPNLLKPAFIPDNS